MSQPWFRLYAEMLDDPKTGRLTDSQFRTWIELLCLQCERGDDDGCSHADVGMMSWRVRRRVEKDLKALASAGLISFNASGEIIITAWATRQFRETDISTERVRRFRQRQHETFQKRRETVSETPPDSETETESTNPPTPLAGGGQGDAAASPERENPDDERQQRLCDAVNGWNRVLIGTRHYIPPGSDVAQTCLESLDVAPSIVAKVAEIAAAVRRNKLLRDEAPWCSFVWAMKPRNAKKLLLGHWPPDAQLRLPERVQEAA